MTVATKSSHTIQIDGMKGEDCCKKVTGALKSVSDIKTHKVEVGSAKIESDHAGCTAACKAIDGVGFKAHTNEPKNDQQRNGQKPDQKNDQKADASGGNRPGAKSDQVELKAGQKSNAGGNAGSKPASGTR